MADQQNIHVQDIDMHIMVHLWRKKMLWYNFITYEAGLLWHQQIQWRKGWHIFLYLQGLSPYLEQPLAVDQEFDGKEMHVGLWQYLELSLVLWKGSSLGTPENPEHPFAHACLKTCPQDMGTEPTPYSQERKQF